MADADIIIIGSGPAGLTAAIYAARADLKPLVVHGPQPGGQLTITTEVENYPGFAQGIQGPELMQQFEEQAKRFGTEFLQAHISSVDLGRRPFTLHTDDHTIKAETLIIASGASAKWLGIPGEAPAPAPRSPRDLVWPAVFGYLGDARWASIYAVAAGACVGWASTWWGTGLPWAAGVAPGQGPPARPRTRPRPPTG